MADVISYQAMPTEICWLLINCCRSGKLEEVRHILSQYSLSECSEWSDGYLLICEALINKEIEIVKLLLRSKAKVNITRNGRSYSDTPLHYAVSIENIEIIEILLDKDADVNATNKKKRTPLHLAIDRRNEEIVKLLLRRGAYVEFTDRHGNTPLHLAAKNGDVKIVQHLINYGADVNSVCKSYTALYFAVKCSNLDIVKLLIQNGAIANPNYTTYYALLQLAIHQDNEKIVQLLLENGHKVDEKADENLKVLCKTAEEGQAEMVKLDDCSMNAAAVKVIPLHNAGDRGDKKDVQLSNCRADVYSKDNEVIKLDDTKTPSLCLDQGFNANATSLRLSIPLQEDNSRTSMDSLFNNKSNAEINDNDLAVRFAILGQEEEQVGSENANFSETAYTNKVEDILEGGTNVKVSTLLHTALVMKRKEIVKILLNHGFDVNAKNEFGRTPMYYAYKYTDLDMCKHLLANGACINLKINGNLNLLHMAVENRDENFVKYLLDQGADINATTNENYTSLHIACRKGLERIVKLLLKHNIDIHKKDNKGFTSLHEVVKQDNEKLVKLLLRKGSDVNATTNYLSTSLHLAALYSQENVMQRLLKYGADVNAKDNKCKTALCYAVESGNMFAVSLLLDKNVDINDKSNKLAFCLAILGNSSEHSKIVEIFLFRGFTINCEDFNDFRIPEPLYSRYVKDYNKEEYVTIFKGLLKCEPSTNAFLEYQILRNSVEKGFLKIVKALLKPGVNINTLLEESCTLLHIAVKNGQFWIVEELLKRGANVNAIDIRGRTPLHISVIKNFRDVVAFLLKYKVDVEARDEDGKTALHLSADGKDHITKLILDSGANINSTSNNESTPLHIAAESGHKEVVELLLSYDAEIDIKNRSNETPLDLAIYWQRKTVVTVLLEHGAMYCISSISSYNRDIYEIMMTHLIKLQAISMDIGKVNFNKKYDDFRLKCNEEVQRMIQNHIGINVSLFDILTREDCIIEMYIRNENIFQFLQSDDHEKSFPIYASMLKVRVNKAKRRDLLIELGGNSLESLLEIKIPNLVTQNLFSYLNNQDLRNLIHAIPTD